MRPGASTCDNAPVTGSPAPRYHHRVDPLRRYAAVLRPELDPLIGSPDVAPEAGAARAAEILAALKP